MDHALQLLLGPSGVVVLVLFILYTGMRKAWVFGWMYREKEAEVKEWKEAALRGTRVAERALSVHEKQEARYESDGEAK